MDMSLLSQEQLAKLLREAEEAHGAYEAQLGHSDDNWPDWYAAFILAKLQQVQGPSEQAPQPSA
jgi:hypothetical protein